MKVPKILPLSHADIEGVDGASINKMCQDALSYIRSFNWVNHIDKAIIEFVVPNVIAVLKVFLDPSEKNIDHELWVVTGDLPDAYLVTDNAQDAGEAMAVYCDLMEEWADSVVNGTDLENAFPVGADPTAENANMLISRTRFLRDKIIPVWKQID